MSPSSSDSPGPGPDLRAALGVFHGVVRENVNLAPMTHVRIGGPARWLVEPRTVGDVAAVVRACRELDLPLQVLGGGSNVLIADAGLAGVVLRLDGFQGIVRDGERCTVGAGVTLPSLIRLTKDAGLAGLELLIGIPAEVGGAVAMNAGTREASTFDTLASATLVDAAGAVRTLTRAELQPRYRDGGLDGRIVVEATFALRRDEPGAIQARLEESLRRRNATQPVTMRSVGCVFRNPGPECAAGALIERAGCKLLRRGGISVSARHANYFVNEGEGTARDFLDLMCEVRARVKDLAGVELEPEVKILGF